MVQEARQCPVCFARNRALRMQSMCGLNDDERTFRLSGIDILNKPGTAQMVKAAQSFIAHPSGIVTLWGGPGNAKTAVLMSVVNELIAYSCESVYTTFADLEGWVREAFDEKQHDEFGSARMRIARLANIHVLAIDEFDKVKVSEWLSELRFDLLDKRYRSGLAGTTGTLLAMNCNPSSLPDWVYSRLSDGRNTIIQNRDPDMRPLMQ